MSAQQPPRAIVNDTSMYSFQDLAVLAAIHFCFIAKVNPEGLKSLNNLRWDTPEMWKNAMARNQEYYEDRALYQHDHAERFEQILSKLCLVIDTPDEVAGYGHIDDLLHLLKDILDAVDAVEKHDTRLWDRLIESGIYEMHRRYAHLNKLTHRTSDGRDLRAFGYQYPPYFDVQQVGLAESEDVSAPPVP